MGDTLFDPVGTPRGIGNQVSAEFNLVYRWHSAISERDEAWTEALFAKMWGKPASEITMPKMLQGISQWEKTMPKDPFQRNFNDLKRGPDRKFSDDELVEIITASIEDVVGASGWLHPTFVTVLMRRLTQEHLGRTTSQSVCEQLQFWA